MDQDELESILEPEALSIQTYCLSNHWYMTESLRDSNCPWTQEFDKRDQGKKLLAMLQPGDIVLVSRLERIFSSSEEAVRILDKLRDKNMKLHIVELAGEVTDPEFTVGFEQAAQLFSSLEKRRAAERIKSVKQRQRKQGRYLGGSRPFGYMIHDNGRLIENPMEQRVLKRIMELKKQGKSLRAISNEVSTPIMPISFKTVQRLLQRHADQL